MENKSNLNSLEERLQQLEQTHAQLANEIKKLYFQIDSLKEKQNNPSKIPLDESPAKEEEQPIPADAFEQYQPTQPTPKAATPKPILQQPNNITKPQAKKTKSDWEKFIGENLINKIGIIVLVLGIAIGAKYAIDHDLISPITRIVLGYLSGVVLMALSIRLQKKFANYSAVLLSGAMAIWYFISYFAHASYDIFPDYVAFVLMLVFTVFTCLASLRFNKIFIALLGLVGAYAVPFLLSNESGNIQFLLTYITIVNLGILYLSFYKSWKLLYYISFLMTWLIFLLWFVDGYKFEKHFEMAAFFASLFFVIFYATFLAYKLVAKERLIDKDYMMILSNSVVYFGMGYLLLYSHPLAKGYIGLFSMAIALLHFVVSLLLKRLQSDTKLFYVVIGLMLVFATLSIPLQLDGNWVTLIWVGEAAILYWLGISKNIKVYRRLAIILFFLSLASTLHDWVGSFLGWKYKNLMAFLNVRMLTNLLVAAAYMGMYWTYKKYQDTQSTKSAWQSLLSFVLPIAALFVLFIGIRMEINWYWNHYPGIDEVRGAYNSELRQMTKNYRNIWLINFSSLFFSALAIINFKRFQNLWLARASLLCLGFSLLAYLFSGTLSEIELFERYQQNLTNSYRLSSLAIYIRYINIAIAVFALWCVYRFVVPLWEQKKTHQAFFVALHSYSVALSSILLLHWLEWGGYRQADKMLLSIYWGIYASVLMVYGIQNKKQYLRITAMVGFAGILIKLFFYDLSQLNTLSKTVVFVVVGSILLLVSYLYNRYKSKIGDE